MDATSDAEEVYMDGNDIVHKFLTSGTFTVHSVGTDSLYGDKVEYLIIGGGGVVVHTMAQAVVLEVIEQTQHTIRLSQLKHTQLP